MLELGLAERIGARLAGQLSIPTPPELANAVEAVLEADEFPVVLGGDCTILLGPMLALRRRGRYGLLFIDGNADFFQPEAEPKGEGASMDLAWVTGHGPGMLTNVEGRAPLVRAEDTVAFGYRDHEDQKEAGSQMLPPELKALDLPAIRVIGIEAAARAAIEHLTRPELDGFFVHLDADVLDDAIMPAVDFRVPDGLSWNQLRIVLQAALDSGKAAGLEVAIYNPALDEDGSAGRGLADVLVAALVD